MTHPFLSDLRSGLRSGLVQLGLDLTEQQQSKLLDFLAMIAKWNKVYNLTAIRNEREMLVYHLLDSLAMVCALQKNKNLVSCSINRMLDVGSGAGLPGVVVAICCPDISVVCVDAVGKKAAFIQQVAATLGITNLRGIHSRVEKMSIVDIAKGFDVITSRAFSSLADFTNLTHALLVEGGVWVAMKATRAEVEMERGLLTGGVAVFHVEQLHVPNLLAERCLVWMRK